MPCRFLEKASDMAKYGKKATEEVERAMRERKKGTLKTGRTGRKVKRRTRQARRTLYVFFAPTDSLPFPSCADSVMVARP